MMQDPSGFIFDLLEGFKPCLECLLEFRGVQLALSTDCSVLGQSQKDKGVCMKEYEGI